jgi:hypothetical protein
MYVMTKMYLSSLAGQCLSGREVLKVIEEQEDE